MSLQHRVTLMTFRPSLCRNAKGAVLGAVARRHVVKIASVGVAVKPVGKPDALTGHVRFDERGRETGRHAVRFRYRALPRLYRRSEGRRTRGALQHTAIISDLEYKSFAISVRFAVCAAEFAKLASIIINGLRVGINALRVRHVN